MAQLNPYLLFEDSCRAAMEFYKSCLGGDLVLNTIGDSPMGAQVPPEMKNRIMHSMLKNEHITLMASDKMKPNQEVKDGNRVTLCMVCDSQDEMERLFTALAEGGNIMMPLKEEFFGWFGMFTDKFGIDWMFQFGMGPKK